MSEDGIKIVTDNRKARHNYFLEDRYEAGLMLKGTEVKALREGQASLQDAYAIFQGKELFLLNAHIPHYKMGNRENHDPLRTRKLLMHRSELSKIIGKLDQKGYTLVPLKMYFKKGMAKVELALGKGKKSHDKRRATQERDAKRQMDRLKRKTR